MHTGKREPTAGDYDQLAETQSLPHERHEGQSEVRSCEESEEARKTNAGPKAKVLPMQKKIGKKSNPREIHKAYIVSEIAEERTQQQKRATEKYAFGGENCQAGQIDEYSKGRPAIDGL